MKRLSIILGLIVLTLALTTASAFALSIMPGGEIASGEENSTNKMFKEIKDDFGIDLAGLEVYKQDVGAGTDVGSLAGSYQTSFSNTPSDPSDALIEYVGGDIASGNPLYLLVKDGNHNPAWYLFNLRALNWDGMEDLVLSGFWPNRGAISHVALYGTSTSVPEPATLILVGAGLAGLGLRKRMQK